MILLDDKGSRMGSVVAETAFVFQQAQRITFRQLIATLFDRNGDQAGVLTAGGGTYHLDSRVLDAQDEVIFSPVGGGTLSTSKLQYDLRKMRWTTEGAYRYDGPTGPTRGSQLNAGLDLKDLGRPRPAAAPAPAPAPAQDSTRLVPDSAPAAPDSSR
jgi:hypothetical protein